MTASCRFDSPAQNNPPARRASSAPSAGPAAQALHSGIRMQVRTLIVLAEDNTELRTLLAGALERVGYRVIQAETGAWLVAVVEDLLAAGEPLRLIITDVRMPVVDGFDAARALREAGHAIPIIFMTAFGDAWTRSRAAELGAVLLDKPLSLGALRLAVARAIASTPPAA